MSDLTPAFTYVFDQELHQILKVLLGLDLNGPDNINVEIFQYKVVNSWYQFKVLYHKILGIWLILSPVAASLINNWCQTLSMKVLQIFYTIPNILLLLITLIEILPSIGHMQILVLQSVLKLVMQKHPAEVVAEVMK